MRISEIEEHLPGTLVKKGLRWELHSFDGQTVARAILDDGDGAQVFYKFRAPHFVQTVRVFLPAEMILARDTEAIAREVNSAVSEGFMEIERLYRHLHGHLGEESDVEGVPV